MMQFKDYPDAVRHDVLAMVPPDGKVIGSIGCGAGATEALLVREGRLVHGVDISSDAIFVASERLTSARCISPYNLDPFDNESLDGLILADVLEHIPQAWIALEHYTRALRLNAWVIISVPNMLSIPALKQVAIRQDWPEEQYGIFDSTHVQFMTRKRLERWCRAAGLDIVSWHGKPIWLGGWSGSLLKIIDRLTRHRFNDFLQYQLQIVARHTRTRVKEVQPS